MKNSSKYIILSVAGLSFILAFWGVGNKDMAGDEASYAFRSVGYLDYLGTSFQTQPVEWYKNGELPFWTHLSFHDHPPLVFAVQNLFFRIFGDNLWSARLPSAIFSAFGAVLVYLLAKELFAAEGIALLAAFLWGTNSVVVVLGRTALMEPVLLFFILLNAYLFLKFTKNNKFWWAFGATFGLAMLAKYSAVFLILLYFIYAFAAERRLLKNPRFYLAFLASALVFSPVLIYNFYLWKTTGHFDLQLSYLFKQATPEWSGLLGKEQAPFGDIFKNLWTAFGLNLVVVVLGIAAFLRVAAKKNLGAIFCLIYILSSTLLLVKIGSAFRFISLFVPIFILAEAFLIYRLWQKEGKFPLLFKIPAVFFILISVFTLIFSNFINQPNYGVAELDNYLNSELSGLSSAAVPATDNPHLNEIINNFSQKETGKEFPVIIVYDDRIAITTLEWVFLRRFFYHAIPVYYVENFTEFTKSNPSGLRGFTVYFVENTENTLLNPFKTDKTAGEEFEKILIDKGLKPDKIIYGNRLEMFRVYKFTL